MFIILIPRTLQVDIKWPQIAHSLYLSLGKALFVLALYLMVLPSLLGIPNFTFFIMDTKFFNFISKVSFWTYLIHYMVVLQVIYRQKIDFYYTVDDIVPIYVAVAAFSVFFGLMGTILVELPFAKLEKMLMNTLMGKK
jgi:peptidoglycan/LPS O-acetylase OafA/YrhL